MFTQFNLKKINFHLKFILIWLANKALAPDEIPPIVADKIINKYGLPPMLNKSEIFFARIKSLELLNK